MINDADVRNSSIDQDDNIMPNILQSLNNLEISFKNLQEENAKLREEIENWNDDINDIWYSIELVEREQNHINQYNRRENIEISGLPERISQDDLETACIRILRRIGVDGLEPWEIAACHRLKKVDGQESRNVII